MEADLFLETDCNEVDVGLAPAQVVRSRHLMEVMK
jgi:hypothetical protein